MKFKIKYTPKYQFGGSNLGNESDAFNSIADYAISRQSQPEDGPSAPQYDTGEDTENATDANAPDEEPDTSALDDLQGKFDDLKAKFDELSAQNGSTGDSMLDFMFADDNPNLPLQFDTPPSSSVSGDETASEPNNSGNIPSYLDPFGGKEYKPTESTFSNLGKKISDIESGGNYGATNPNSTATGKYQFLWGKKPGQGWGDSIKQVTGVKDRSQFLKSPAAQEKYYAWYEKNVLAPHIQELAPYNKQGLDTTQLGKLIHFRGLQGAKDYLQGKLKDKPEAYNIPISQYIKQNGGSVNQVMDTLHTTRLTSAQQAQFNKWKGNLPKKLQSETDYDLKGLWIANPSAKPSSNLHFPDTYKLPNHPTFSNESMYYNQNTQPYAGQWNETDSSFNYVPYDTTRQTVVEHKQNGGVAVTPQEQYDGLNNPAHDQMFFPNTGMNTFRGLDNGQPVLLHDQLGRKFILRGKHDTAQVYGNVHEKRLK